MMGSEREREAIRVMMGSPCGWRQRPMHVPTEIPPIYTIFIVFRYVFIVRQFAGCRI